MGECSTQVELFRGLLGNSDVSVIGVMMHMMMESGESRSTIIPCGKNNSAEIDFEVSAYKLQMIHDRTK